MSRVWWVNQSSRKGSADNETVWAPKASADGKTPGHWGTILQVQAGDLIYHYTDTYLVGVSRAVSGAITATNPYVDRATNWENLGNRIPVDYSPFDAPVHRDAIPVDVRTNNAGLEHGPFNKRGQVAQGYLYPVSPELFAEISRLTGFEFAVGASSEDLDDQGGPTDAMAEVLVRREQPVLRARLLAERSSATCGVCGADTPEQYLVAGHIKKRSDATERERRHPHIAMLICLFGCDRAFEVGDALVGPDGQISVSERLRQARPQFAERLDGCVAPAHNDQSAKFFEHRRQSFATE